MIILDPVLKRYFRDDDNSFTDIMSLQGEEFRTQPGRRTLRFERDGNAYFVKLHCGVGWREIFKNLFTLRLPVLGARNEWLAIQRLNELKIATMSLAAYGSRCGNPAKRESFVITHELDKMVSLEEFCRTWPDRPPAPVLKYKLIANIAEIARSLHTNGVNHRDFYLCHFLLDTHLLNRLYLIDLHRVQLRKTTPERWLIKDLGGLYYSALKIGLTRRDIFRFIKNYDKQTLRNSLTKQRHFWIKVKDNAQHLSRKTLQT